MWGCPRLQAAFTLDGTATVKEAKRRRLYFWVMLMAALASLLDVVMNYEVRQARILHSVSYAIYFPSTLCGVVIVLSKCRLSTPLIVFTLYGVVLSIFLEDLSARTLNYSFWPTLVLVVDFMILLQVDTFFCTALVIFTVFWLLLMGVEGTYRLGLFDLPGLPQQGGEHGRREYYRKLTECEKLPCAVEQIASIVAAISVFVTDFVATRKFASGLLKEQESMERTINVVQEIASLLAGYDVEQVAELLKTHEGDLPEGMTVALRGLEENLRKYRPYLPAALFEAEVDEDGVQQPTVAPPGLDTETATIVFTDIRASTSIWEIAPEGMRAGLQIHNAVMRDVMRMCGGYEVKTIGDAFMIAFASTCDGVAFGLRVQERLFEADWPASLLEDAPICSRQGLLWGGLTVRIGVNTGPVTVEQNTLTGRTDYLGHTVNVAARMESTCTPGAVALPFDLWSSECWSCSAVVSAPEEVHLKGVADSISVCCVWPVSLGGRRRTLLCETLSEASTPLLSSSNSGETSLASAGSVASRFAHFPPSFGTVGVAQLAVGDVTHNTAFPHMSSILTTLTITLEQSGGSLVTLLGNCVCVGWNVSRSAPAHMENAIRFVQRMSVKSALNGAGLASGPVQHGDVGARRQRFVTVMGDVVRRSWALCEEAVRDGVVCLYEPPEGTTLPSVLEDFLVRHKGSNYRVVESDNLERDNVF